MTRRTANQRRVGMRWGALVAYVSVAAEALADARAARDLLPKDLADRLDQLARDVSGLEQAIWRVESDQ